MEEPFFELLAGSAAMHVVAAKTKQISVQRRFMGLQPESYHREVGLAQYPSIS
jgi:hypothetical protein